MSSLTEGKKAPLISYVVLIVFGAVFFLFGTLMLNGYGSKSSCTEPVTAKVVKMEKRTSRSSGKHHKISTTYAPVFEYKYDGKQYTYTSTVATNPPEFSAGEQVTILVDPNAPNKIYYEPKVSTVALSIAFRILGGIIAIGGAALLIVRKAKNQIA